MGLRRQIEAAVDRLRPGFAADGTQVVVSNIEDGQVEIKILLGPAACQECLLPPEQVAQVFTNVLRPIIGEACVVTVEVEPKKE